MGSELPAFLRRLRDEHRIFLDAFGALHRAAKEASDEASRLETLRALHDFATGFFEEFHHRKEEELLFPLLARDPRIHAGGPECVLHFDVQMRSPPIEAARASCRREGLKATEPPWPELRERWRRESSPLLIPAEDHEAGRILLRAVAGLLTIGSVEDSRKALRLLEDYGDLQRRHIRKEDGCLLCMARQLLEPAQWRELEEREPPWSAAGLHPLAVTALATTAS